MTITTATVLRKLHSVTPHQLDGARLGRFYKWAVKVDEYYYPLKRAWERVRGLAPNSTDEHTHRIARHFKAAGFVVVRIQRR